MAALAIVAIATAAAATIFRYDAMTVVAPGATFQTSGWANREHNRVCRNGNSGQARARYLNTSGVVVADTGVKWTNCGTGATASLENDGYFRSWCRHEGTVNWEIVCQTTRPS